MRSSNFIKEEIGQKRSGAGKLREEAVNKRSIEEEKTVVVERWSLVKELTDEDENIMLRCHGGREFREEKARSEREGWKIWS